MNRRQDSKIDDHVGLGEVLVNLLQDTDQILIDLVTRRLALGRTESTDLFFSEKSRIGRVVVDAAFEAGHTACAAKQIPQTRGKIRSATHPIPQKSSLSTADAYLHWQKLDGWRSSRCGTGGEGER